MAVVLLDTSALVRRYDRSEPGAARVRAVCARPRGHTLLVARLTAVEMASAISRKVREGALDAAIGRRLWGVFRAHWRDQYQVVALTDDVCAHAERLLFRHGLRSLDALQVGCALVVATRLPHLQLEFWTADARRAQAARLEGLTVEVVG